MWPKGGRIVVKVVCLGFSLGAYTLLKYATNEIAWFKREDAQIVTHSENNVQDSVPERNHKSDRKFWDYGVVHGESGQGWQRFHSGSVYSRHLLAVLPNCTPRAVDQFPWDHLTDKERKQGFLVLHVLLAVYMFLALAIVCDRYFVPSLEVLCEYLNLQTDVAGATFMAAGSSAPELATAIIGVFVAKADVGLSTVVGSAIYNVMFVISMCALFATSVIHLHWWPLFRDCIAYLFSVLALVLIIYDAEVQWYETVVLMVLYVLYVCFMFFNQRLQLWCVPRIETLSHCLRSKSDSTADMGSYQKFEDSPAVDDISTETKDKDGEKIQLTDFPDHAHQEAESWHRLCAVPEGVGWQVVWAVSLPLSLLFYATVPDCRRPTLRRLFWLTFLMSLVWLSVVCFLMVWMITVVGYTLDIPDSVMSLTFIAFGVSLPDVVSSVLVVRDGLGDMAMSNAIGSNVFDILVCLGVPWFLQTCVKAPGSSVPVYSEGLLYSSVMLLSTVLFLLLVTHVYGWQLTTRYGLLLLFVYFIYTLLATLYELNVFGYFHPPECPSNY